MTSYAPNNEKSSPPSYAQGPAPPQAAYAPPGPAQQEYGMLPPNTSSPQATYNSTMYWQPPSGGGIGPIGAVGGFGPVGVGPTNPLAAAPGPVGPMNPGGPYAQQYPPGSTLPPGVQYQQQLMNMCAQGNHDITTKYGAAGIIMAVVCFPIGLIALFVDQERRCVRCGVRVG